MDYVKDPKGEYFVGDSIICILPDSDGKLRKGATYTIKGFYNLDCFHTEVGTFARTRFWRVEAAISSSSRAELEATADRLIALINSSPRSPTRQEILTCLENL